MGSVDQHAAARVISRLDHVLADEAVSLEGLRHDLTAPINPAVDAAGTAFRINGDTGVVDTDTADTAPASADTARTALPAVPLAPTDRLAATRLEQDGRQRVVLIGPTRTLAYLIVAAVVLAAIVTGLFVAWLVRDPTAIGRAPGRVQALAFSPDGKILAAGCDDGTVKLRNFATHQPIGSPHQPAKPVDTNSVYAVAISSDLKSFAFGGDSGDLSSSGVVRLDDLAHWPAPLLISNGTVL
jgi:hypothetical protein